jgi:hypothetical protein
MKFTPEEMIEINNFIKNHECFFEFNDIKGTIDALQDGECLAQIYGVDEVDDGVQEIIELVHAYFIDKYKNMKIEEGEDWE